MVSNAAAISLKASEFGEAGVIENLWDAWKHNLCKTCQIIVDKTPSWVWDWQWGAGMETWMGWRPHSRDSLRLNWCQDVSTFKLWQNFRVKWMVKHVLDPCASFRCNLKSLTHTHVSCGSMRNLSCQGRAYLGAFSRFQCVACSTA